MEENNKNNAIEKVENIAEENERKTFAEELKEEVQSAQKPARKSIISKIANKKPKLSQEEKLKQKQEREKQREEDRLKKARLADEKSAQRKEKRIERKELQAEHKADLKREKLRKKEERLKRRDLLKNETKVERLDRIAREKQEKKELAQARRAEALALKEERAMIKREKIRAKKELKAQKRKLSLENKKDKRSRGIGGWLAAVISLSCVVLVLGTLFTFSLVNNFGGMDFYENAIQRSFYDLVSYVDNMDVSLSKLMVSNDSGEQQKLLSDITVQANLAMNDLAEIPLQDESRYYTAKYINQVGDFSKYLNNKLIDGGNVTEEDKETIGSLYKVNSALKGELTTLSTKIGPDYKFTTLMSDGGENLVMDSFKSLEKSAVDYPQMIYDGPFSDGMDTVKVKGLSGEEVTAKEALDIFKSAFDKVNFENVEILGEVNGKIPSYGIEGIVEEDVKVYAEISKVGGKLIMFDYFKNYDEGKIGLEDSIAIADKYIEAMGFKNMKPVWANERSSVAYVNFALEENGVIVYPDMIKVTVCQGRGMVSGFDATEYYLNHTKRTIGKAKITKEQALKNLSANIEADTVRLALIPKSGDKETLAYEISGSFNGATYYVYIDAVTGKECQIFRVVETTEGTLLM